MPKKSERLNNGRPPPYLEEFVTGSLSDDSNDDKDLDVTIKMEDSRVTSLLEGLTNQITLMQAQLMQNTEVQTRMEEKNNELHQKLEATNRQLAEVQRTMKIEVPPTTRSSAILNNSVPVTLPAQLDTPSPSITPTRNSTHQQSTPSCSIPSFSVYPNNPVYWQQHPSLPVRKYLVALPKFDGNPCDWLVFNAEYKRTTTEFAYTSSENTTRLNSSLQGKARELVQWLLIHDDMAEKIMERLYSRFGRPELLVDAQITMLKNIPGICENNVGQIIPFADKVINFSHFMLTCSSQHQLANPTLLNELILKLPMNMRIAWASHISSLTGVPSILDFSNWIEVKADNIARVPVCNSLISPTEKKTTPKKYQMLHTSNVTSKKEMNCVLCEKNHFIANCPDFLNKSTDDKWKLVTEKKLCFSCLKFGHSTRMCRIRKSCNKNGCNRVHHPQLHSECQDNKSTPTVLNMEVSCHAALKANESKVLFKVVPVKLYNRGEVVSTYALIDEGSSVSLIKRTVAVRLKLKGPMRKLNLQWFGDHCSSEETEIVKFNISGIHNNAEVFEMRNVCTVNNLCLPMQTVDMNQLHSKYDYLQNLPIASYTDARPELLIGLDFCHLGLSNRKIQQTSNGPIVAESPLGWIVYGRTVDNEIQSSPERMFHVRGYFDDIHSIVKDYFTTENFGVELSTTPRESSETVRARQLLESTTKKVKGRYESGLLWKNDDIVLPDSYPMAISRLRNVENKMKKEPVYGMKYKETIVSYVQKGYARKLSSEEVVEISPRTWYLPHFGVLNPNKPGKFRLVFDAAAKVGETSLNSSLLTGPDLNQPLLTVLSKFREGQVGVCADIKEMFHQVIIREEDQNSQRFLWRNDKTGEIEVYKMLVMIFGSTSSPTTAQYVKNFHATQYLESHHEAAKAIIERHYVDDYVNSFHTDEQAITVSMMVKNIEMAGGFELRGFISNSRKVTSILNQEQGDQLYQVDMNLDKSSTCDKILGMNRQ
ncbi:uncharacterized protein LOC116176098 [Photinus pyralis]|uniref:uncharacterized protein LOC116176098 n=1 Tax=Photinus pyralis TaxID=7054 RepID=UPI0012674AAA|nr:uncharacterized protein LOC116176098 [Photinus pyralis]